jgi:hypothetical protein
VHARIVVRREDCVQFAALWTQRGVRDERGRQPALHSSRRHLTDDIAGYHTGHAHQRRHAGC